MRCSSGLVVDRYLGSFHRRTATDIDLPAINADQSIAVQLRHDDKLDKEAFLQFVVLYTTTQGERRIRFALPLLLLHHTSCIILSVLQTILDDDGCSLLCVWRAKLDCVLSASDQVESWLSEPAWRSTVVLAM